MTKNSGSNALKPVFAACFAAGMVLYGHSTAHKQEKAEDINSEEASRMEALCACLEESEDLWLCGLADEPTPAYNLNNRAGVNALLIEGALEGHGCKSAEPEARLDEKS